jgi:DNA-binding FadR family transcriptional regulator
MRKASSLLVARVAQDLRKQAFASSPGAFLGSEAALVEQLNVSRPTFRQAAKLVEQEQLLVIKPGAGGGYFARQPDSAAVAHMTGVYLQSRNTTAEDLVTAFTELYVVTARTAAARRPDSAALARLYAFAEQEQTTLNEPMDWKVYACSQTTFVDILTDLGRNPLMKLFFEITVEMTNYLFDSIAPLKPAKIQASRLTRMKLMDAIRQGNAEMAESLARHLTDETRNWMLNKPH